ncbi:MAG TPA: serine/threonine-protein kinase [Fimbriimonadaceae bacterium]|nr:serine/threonine-protein kinase [Fimbriimonadaceae bacterium]
MSQGPEPLDVGVLLAGRFEIERVLGRGGFGIAYLVADVVRKDKATLKELAPHGAIRGESGLLDLDAGSSSSHRLRQSFLEEARLLSRLNIPGILPIRAVFTENGTAYYATDHLAQAVTLERLLLQEGRMDPQGAMDILYQLLETLEAVHAKGILHRDVKPSNVLVSPKGQALLIDFGSAREWHADAATRHTVLYTPGYAPIEQLSERGRRGPATDLYALCATAYRMLTGSIPMPATDRANGAELTPLRLLRPDVEIGVAFAIEAGLRLRYHDRPQTIAEFREMLAEGNKEDQTDSLTAYDAKLLKLQRFGFERRQCPACRGLLEEPKPLKRWTCPVCREATIRQRDIPSRLCPACQLGTLHRRANDNPLAFCPLCRTGQLAHRRQGLVKRKLSLDCLSCKAGFTVEGDSLTLVRLPEHKNAKATENQTMSAADWRKMSGRGTEVWVCDGCDAQFDLLPDGRWGQVTPKPKRYHALYPEEWARIASGLPPGAGNASCEACRADYFVDDNRLTLLNAEADPYGFAAEHLGRLLDADDARWLGVGKDSPNPGFVCADCGTELDFEGEYLRLVKTSNRSLVRHIGEPRKLVDWHRLALGLPEVHEEEQFRTSALSAIEFAFETGEIGFGGKNDVIWKGPAIRDGHSGVLTVAKRELAFGGALRKWRVPLDAVVEATSYGDDLYLRPSGEEEPVILTVSPVELSVRLSSGSQTVTLRASNLAKRIMFGRKPA